MLIVVVLLLMMLLSIPLSLGRVHATSKSHHHVRRVLRLYQNSNGYTGTNHDSFISSSQNDQVKLMKSLQLKKKREEHGLVVLEGYRQIMDALQNGLQPKRIFLSDYGITSSLYSKLQEIKEFQRLPNGVLLRVTNDISASLSDTVNDQGIIAAFEKPVFTSLKLLDNSGKSKYPLVVVLDGIADPGNAGTIIRSAYGLGADAIVGIQCCDLWSPKVLRASMGSSLRFPIIETSWIKASNIIQSLIPSQTSYQILVADGSDSSHVNYTQVDYSSKPTLLVIGSEAHGPSEKISTLAKREGDLLRIQIPMLRAVESFNAGVAASIILAEAAKQKFPV